MMNNSTRDKVLRTLLTHPRITVNELADEVGISPISVRHHISYLMANMLVSSDEERHGVGRPRQVFLLTETGVEQFPTHYIQLLSRLLVQIKETMPAAVLKQLFIQMAEELAEDLIDGADIQSLKMQERLELVTNILKREGFAIEWERQGDHYLIRQTSCPYYYIGQNHPEVCSVDQFLISTMIAAPALRTECIQNGDPYCTYLVSDPATMENQA